MPNTLFTGLVDAAKRYGRRFVIAEDSTGARLTYGALIGRSLAIGRKLAAGTRPGEHVGVLLPNVNGLLVTLFGLFAFGRVPAMLNFSAGVKMMGVACSLAGVKVIVTSRAFIEVADLEKALATLERGRQVVFLEDVRDSLSFADKLRVLRDSSFGGTPMPQPGLDDPAAVLFTSGSEGTPKGVVLSHGNLISNVRQCTARVDFGSQDILFNALPLFHSFGLLGGAILPVLSGMRVVLYPNPLHYHLIPELIRKSGATMMFGTNTFLRGYARVADREDFRHLRLVIAGAERLQDDTRRLYIDRFGITVMQGYGVTEASPVIAVNTLEDEQPGTVGRALDGIETALAPVPGIDGAGRLMVRGPNVMLGYLTENGLQRPEDGWYDTGDIVSIDDGGYLTIRGRAKRFAKIGGEMVSLAIVEDLARDLCPDGTHAALALQDARKGEQILLVTTDPALTRDALHEATRQNGLSELHAPRQVIHRPELPCLGAGKIDYVSLASQTIMGAISILDGLKS